MNLGSVMPDDQNLFIYKYESIFDLVTIGLVIQSDLWNPGRFRRVVTVKTVSL